jgi:hypothetical protein
MQMKNWLYEIGVTRRITSATLTKPFLNLQNKIKGRTKSSRQSTKLLILLSVNVIKKRQLLMLLVVVNAETL